MGLYRRMVERKNVVAQPLKDRRSTLLRQNWSGPRPPTPVIEVNAHTCAVNHSMQVVRDVFFTVLVDRLGRDGGVACE